MRHYDGGVIVGEALPPKALKEFFVWLDSELVLVDKLLGSEEDQKTLGVTSAYLNGRKGALRAVNFEARGLRSNG